MAAGKWHRVNCLKPCRICGKPDWCGISADGRLIACRRVEQGAWKTKKDKDGTPYYLHRSVGSDSPAALPPIQPAPMPTRADPDTLHAVYSALLARLRLSSPHRADLQRRGLPDSEVDGRGYRTLSVQGRARLAWELHERFDNSVLRVPGFITRERGSDRYLTLAGPAGILVPVRDLSGRIVALKIRRDSSETGSRYCVMSSAKYGGPGPGAPAHIPEGIKAPADTVRMTEGELKADIAFVLSGLPTISAPGVSSWRQCLAPLKELNCRTVRLAIDSDAKDKASVARALDACASALATEGYAVELERWPEAYKGIDDALADGASIEVLTGDAARQVITEIVNGGTAGEPSQEPGHIERLAAVLAEGPESLYRDREVLQALARLAEVDPAEYACCRAQAHASGVRLRDLDRALAPLRQEIRAQRPPPDAAGPYRTSAGRIVRIHLTPDGEVEIPLCNFVARIVEVVTRDNGAEQSVAFTVEGALWDGRPLPQVTVTAAEFARLDWVTVAWKGNAIIFAGQGTQDHLRCAIELLSPDLAQRMEYVHSGWREIDRRWYYLHAAGAIGPDGAAAGIAVSLLGSLTRFELPTPSQGEALVRAVRASLRLLDLGPPRHLFPLACAVYRAVLGPCDFSLHVCGPTGVFKSETAALFQQHFGKDMDARHLPGSWSSTGNALEVLGFTAKDAILVVDDFAPSGSMADVQRFHREADRVLRAQGNNAGRRRLRSDATLKADKPPGGLIVSTGEDVPRGQSLRARLLVLEFSAGEIDAGRLTACQRDAAAGLFSETLAGFLVWLAPRYSTVQAKMLAEVAQLRDMAIVGSAHARTAGIVANLAAGWKHFLAFAFEAEAITEGESRALFDRAWRALGEAAAGQVEHVAAAEPVDQFLRLLTGALASGRAHVAGTDGNAPLEPGPWGRRGGDPQGERIGWVSGPDLFLEPEAAYAEAQELARGQGDSLSVTA